MKKKPTIAISPVSNDYLTKGKEYEIINKAGKSFWIESDTGTEIFCLFDKCEHINLLSWTLK